jgi:hypothetical protein
MVKFFFNESTKIPGALPPGTGWVFIEENKLVKSFLLFLSQ